MSSRSYVIKCSIGDPTLWRKMKSPVPDRLDIELTERCNNNCLHCNINLPADDARAKARELRTRDWKNILRQIADAGVLSVRFTGGEPLLREDFSELYLFARRLGLTVLIFTNGRLITPQLADLLSRIPPREALEVSVYGMREKSYEAVTRAKGSYAEFCRGLELLRKRKIRFVVKGALLPPNRGELKEFEAWAKTLPGLDAPPAPAMFFDLRKRRDSTAKKRLIAGLRVSPETGLEVIIGRQPNYCQELTNFIQRFTRPCGDKLFTCGAGQGGCLDAYGRLHACLLLRHPDLAYDLKNGSIREGLRVVLSRLRQMQAANPEYLARCARCFLRGLCEQCPARSWAEHGTLDTPVEYFCELAHVQALWLGLLVKDEKAWRVKDWKERIKRLERR